MAGGPDGLEDDPLAVGSYSQLLFSDDVVVDDLDADGCFTLTSAFSSDHQHPPKMLCFGDFAEECDFGLDKSSPKIVQKTLGVACSDSSSPCSTSTNNININTTKTTNNSLSKANKKRNVSAGTTGAREQVQRKNESSSGDGNGGAPVGNQRKIKKTKSDNSSDQSTGHAKAKKEKLGERILALQQLVSPFGKTDTASVLHEAMGYIRFLHDQVQVLCSPYLQRLPSSPHLHESGENGGGGGGESGRDLRSKGLCVAPIQLTLHVADDNGADFWSPAMVNHVSSS